MAKLEKQLLTTRELCERLKIHRHSLEKWVKAGLPIAGRKSGVTGRRPWLFNPAAVARWAIANGRDLPAITGEQIKSAMIAPPTPAPKSATVDADEQTAPLLLQLRAERSQYEKLFARFLRTHASEDAAGIAALAKTITSKSDSLRRLEMTALEYRRQSGDLVEMSKVRQLFYEKASGTRDRVMALANTLIPILRDYLRDPDDAGAVQDIIDREIRHALTALPSKLPEVKNAK